MTGDELAALEREVLEASVAYVSVDWFGDSGGHAMAFNRFLAATRALVVERRRGNVDRIQDACRLVHRRGCATYVNLSNACDCPSMEVAPHVRDAVVDVVALRELVEAVRRAVEEARGGCPEALAAGFRVVSDLFYPPLSPSSVDEAP